LGFGVLVSIEVRLLGWEFVAGDAACVVSPGMDLAPCEGLNKSRLES
jgi:hypothetical protein